MNIFKRIANFLNTPSCTPALQPHTAPAPPKEENPQPLVFPKMIRMAVGPSPWAWIDRSFVMAGKRYRFRGFAQDESSSGLIQVLNEQDQIILLLNFKVYARMMDDGRILMWWEGGGAQHRHIAFTQFHIEQLSPILSPLEAAREMCREKAYQYGLDDRLTVRINCFLPAGSHPVDSPDEWADFEETLVHADHAAQSPDSRGAHRALFCFDWIKRQVTVLPQDWYNEGQYDYPYQWPARISRAETGAFFGEGVRLGHYELDESGRTIKRWLVSDPFHMIQ
jgi:hypothetical protein